jgi:hypothetical protein
MLQFVAYLTIVIYASISLALAWSVIYNRKTFMVQATVEIFTYDGKL